MSRKYTWISWAAAGAIVLTALVLWRSQRGAGDVAAGGEKAWFTVDAGTTWFPDDSAKAPPFEYQGKTAVRCYVFTCDGGTTKFAGYLERFRAEAKEALENGTLEPGGAVTGVEVKKPGDAAWVARTDPRAMSIMRPRCDDGKTPDPVLP